MAEAGSESTLERHLNYRFRSRELLQQALTHRSYSSSNNERLEFLGDSILNFCIAAQLYTKFPQATEGDLSRMRANLVKGETLSEIAADWGLGECLRLGSGEASSGGRRRASILADAVESVIGAIYLDSGMPEAAEVILHSYTARLQGLDPSKPGKDPKTRLQEKMQAVKQALPQYSLQRSYGKAHDKRFVVQCQVAGLNQPTTGEGRSRREAEQAAAEAALAELGSES